jgi:glutathione synthase/RimK-type ligase-like ATP-grasp enzyme
MHFTIIGNPENRRITSFCEAAQKLGYGVPSVISYLSWLSGQADPAVLRNCLLKIDSPGEDDRVRKMLIARGKGEAIQQIASQPNDHGAIHNMPAWYAGYCNWLHEIRQVIDAQGPIGVMNDPADIELQFDKPRCQEWLQQHGIPVPFRLPAISSYDDLLHNMQQHGLNKVFIKPAHASSASGVIAFRKTGHRVQAVTSAEMLTSAQGIQLYNSLKVRTYTSEQDIAVLINRLAQENVFAEAWLPKATLNERYFDTRVLVIDGKARHTVIRTSSQVITNLHLGNRRGDMQTFIDRIGADNLHAIQQLAEQTAACFPASLYMGIDILLTADWRNIVVLEVNAFGDLLPGLLDAGETCYEAQIRAMIRKHERNVERTDRYTHI